MGHKKTTFAMPDIYFNRIDTLLLKVQDDYQSRYENGIYSSIEVEDSEHIANLLSDYAKRFDGLSKSMADKLPQSSKIWKETNLKE